MATVEARYLGEVFGRPSPEPLPRWQDSDGGDRWARIERAARAAGRDGIRSLDLG